jgi:PAS domain-containing protein
MRRLLIGSIISAWVTLALAPLIAAAVLLSDASGPTGGDDALTEAAVLPLRFVLASAVILPTGLGLAAWYLLAIRRRVAHDPTHLHMLACDLPGMLYETDGEHRLTFVSEASGSLLGRPPEDLLGLPLTDLVEELPAESGRPEHDGTQILRGDSEWRRADGSLRRLSTLARATYDETSVLTATRGVVTERVGGG